MTVCTRRGQRCAAVMLRGPRVGRELHHGGDRELKRINSPADGPDLDAGDMSFARCDVRHRTQDVEPKRIALTLRVFART